MSHEIEKAVVSICLTWPERLADVDLKPEQFQHPLWRDCWSAMLSLEAGGQGIDPIMVSDALVAAGNKHVSPSDLPVHLESPVMLGEYARLLAEQAATRAVLSAISAVMTSAREEGIKGDELLSMAYERLSRVEVGQPDGAVPVSEILRERFAQLAEIAAAKARGEVAATGIPTKVEGLDKLLGGLQRGIVTLVAARPMMGKSAFALSVTDNVASAGLGVHVFSLEDTRDAYADRILSRRSRTPATKLRSCELSRSEVEALGRVRTSDLGGWLVDDRSGITAEEIVRSARRARAKNKTELVIVDYVQLVRGPRELDRFATVGHAIDVFADAAKQDRLAYLVLSQLNRECEKREDKRPLLSDLKASGSLEERAKVVLMLYRESVYKDLADPHEIEVLIRKNSNGPIGWCSCGWDPETLRVY